MVYDKIVIWGFDRNNHTHFYIHWAWQNAFKFLGYETYWFSNENNPKDFSYNNCLFITEGYVDQNIPLNKSSTYIVHVCIDPLKYLGNVKRLIDLRYLVDHIKDINYNYVLDKKKCEKISDTLFSEVLKDNSGISKFSNNPTNMDYESVYTCWGTDLLPHEINEDDIYIKKEKRIYWFGSATPYNNNEVLLFAKECVRNEIEFVINDPWTNPQSFEIVRQKTKVSFLAPDIRSAGDPGKISLGETGTMHKSIGYIACRLFKSISYGQLGITNSLHMHKSLEELSIYNSDESKLFYDSISKMSDYSLIKEQMKIVKDKHTFVKRVKDLLQYLANS